MPIYEMYLELLKYQDQCEIVGIGIEKVHAVPGASAGSSFKFGYNYGAIVALLSTLGGSIYDITPKGWQKYIGLSIPSGLSKPARRKRIKKGVGEICTKLYPRVNVYGVRGGLIDGKSDSLCIAHTILHTQHLDKL